MVFIISVKGKQNLPNDVFVRFKMNGCTHCINSQPEWDKACKRIENKYYNPNVAMVEIERLFENQYNFFNQDGTPFSSSGYPEHVLFRNKILVHKFNQERKAELIEKAIVEQFNLKQNRSRQRKTIMGPRKQPEKEIVTKFSKVGSNQTLEESILSSLGD